MGAVFSFFGVPVFVDTLHLLLFFPVFPNP